MGRQRDMVVRQMKVFQALGTRRRGVTIAQLIELVGASRATVYRDIDLLESVGVPIDAERINGEARYRVGERGTFVAIDSAELAAIALARRALDGLDGTLLVEQLDRLLRRAAPQVAGTDAAPGISLVVGHGVQSAPVVRAIDLAIRHGHRFAFDYRGAADDGLKRRTVDPVSLRLHASQLYLVAFDLDRSDWRLYKVARVAGELEILGQAEAHPEYDAERLFAHSAGVWIGERVSVAVRLDESVARLVQEWPLTPSQAVVANLDGSVVVQADVAGIAEALRWTLSWGGAAEALEPSSLREAVAGEVRQAAANYPEQVVSQS